MSSRPNILLLFPDQWRADWTQFNPMLPLRTPNIAALAARGARFTRAITPSPLCAPARASLASGREYGRSGVRDNRDDFPASQRTFYQLLQRAGYHVMGCGKFDLAKAARGWKVDGSSRLTQWGFDAGIDSEGKWDAVDTGRVRPAGPYMAFLESRGLRQAHVDDMRRRAKARPFDTWPSPLPDDAYGDNWVAEQGLRLVAGAPSGKPWFLQVNFPGPHDPWDITPNMAELYQNVDFPLPDGVPVGEAQAHQAVHRHYAAMIENIDRRIGLFVDLLRRQGQLDNTVIVVSSDHGEMLGQKRLWGKHLPHQASLAVPMIVAGPSIPGGATLDGAATLLDLPATFLDLAGALAPDDWDSLSLLPILQGRPNPRPRQAVFSGMPAWRAVYDGRHKLVVRQGAMQLFDLAVDEETDVSAANAAIVERLLNLSAGFTSTLSAG